VEGSILVPVGFEGEMEITFECFEKHTAEDGGGGGLDA